MTLVHSPHFSMPSDGFASGLDIFPPHMTMNPQRLPESQWNQQPPFDYSSYDEKPLAPPTFPQSHDTLPPNVPNYPRPAYPPRNRPPPIELASVPHDLGPINRPKSSPSTFGTSVEELLFSENPFRSKVQTFPPTGFAPSPHHVQGVPDKMTSPFYDPSGFVTPNPSHSPHQPHLLTSASDPAGLTVTKGVKRGREDDEISEYGQRKRRRAPSQSGPVELNSEEQLLLRLKEEENLPWKDIAVRFQTDLGKSYQVPALQMRFKRLRERMRTWTENDVQALEQAHDYWEKFRYDIIAAKMLDFGATERWPAKYCARKWEELHPGRTTFTLQPQPQYLRDPWDTTSPVSASIGRFSPSLGPSV